MVAAVDWINHHQQMDYLVVLVVGVVIILVPDLVDQELLVKENLVVLDIGNLAEHTMVVVVVVQEQTVELVDLLMVMPDLVVMVFRFPQHSEIQQLLRVMHQTHSRHKEVVV
jgi:hypothetical protein